MSINDRDKKILIGLIPVVLLAALWFLVFAPKQSEASKVSDQLSKAQASRDKAKAKAATIETAKADYAKDYETVVHLGKAIPSNVDMPSLIVQLSRAAEGTHISFRKIKAGDRVSATATATTTAPPSTGSSGSSGSSGSTGSTSGGSTSGSSGTPPASGGQTPPASNGQQPAANTSTTPQTPPSSGSGSGSTSAPSSSSGSTTAPPAAGATGATGTTGAATPPGLDTVPLEFGFDGSFFDLADFFHRMKRFVHVANRNLRVGGRLMTLDSVSFDATTFPTLSGEIKATIYLAPKDQGNTAGATPSGPSASTPASSGSSTAAPGAPTNASAPAPGSTGALK